MDSNPLKKSIVTFINIKLFQKQSGLLVVIYTNNILLGFYLVRILPISFKVHLVSIAFSRKIAQFNFFFFSDVRFATKKNMTQLCANFFKGSICKLFKNAASPNLSYYQMNEKFCFCLHK